MRGPWYVTKRLFASFATAIFRKICRPLHGQKHKYGMGPHIARVKTKNILNLRIGLFEKPLSYVELIVLRTDYLRGPLFVHPPSGWGVQGALVSALERGLQFFCWVVVNYAQYCFYAIVNCIKILQKIKLIQDFLR